MMANREPNFKIDRVEKLAGFPMADIPNGHYGWILCRGFFHSEQRDFYLYVNQLSNIFLKNLLIDNINTFLIIHHADLSADIYINELLLKFRMMAKRDIKPNEFIYTKDIADIDEIMFDGIEIKNDDNIIFCFKKGWRLGLFFDFNLYGTDQLLDVNALYHELGKYYKYLMFKETYSVIENEPTFKRMFNDGWFPFVQILGNEFERLADFYRDKEKLKGLIEKLISNFDENRISSFTNNWWSKSLFKDKQPIIESGIESYLTGKFIACIKTLFRRLRASSGLVM